MVARSCGRVAQNAIPRLTDRCGVCNDPGSAKREVLMDIIHEALAAIAFVVFCIATIAICTVLA